MNQEKDPDLKTIVGTPAAVDTSFTGARHTPNGLDRTRLSSTQAKALKRREKHARQFGKSNLYAPAFGALMRRHMALVAPAPRDDAISKTEFAKIVGDDKLAALQLEHDTDEAGTLRVVDTNTTKGE